MEYMLTCVHCGQPIEHANGVWYHPHRRFRCATGSLPTLCDFGDRLGPTHAAPAAVTSADKDFLCSIHVASDDENFMLEALWLDWKQANVQRGHSLCADCGAAPGGQHSLECSNRAVMTFEYGALRSKHAAGH